MKTEKYIPKGSIIESSLRYAYKNSIPIISTIEVTQDCNFSCTHCYNFDRTKINKVPNRSDAMSPARILSLIDELNQAGTLFLNLSGGEALATPHIFEYIKKASSLNMEVRLKTNASLLDQSIIEKLIQAGLKGMDISLYGASEEAYQKLTGTQGSFAKVLGNISSLKKTKLDTHISIILNRDNFIELESMIEICNEHQFLYQVSTEITERYDNSTGSRDLEITDEQFKVLAQKENFETNGVGNFQCSCARSVCGINFAGDLYPCIGAPIFAGNVKDRNFNDLWKNSDVLNGIRDLKPTDFKECISCNYQESCNRSSGSVFINTGNYTGCDETVLRQAKITHSLKSKDS